MEQAAVSASTSPAVAFRDGLGERRHVVDPSGHEAIEVLCLRPELSSVPSFEFALRERVSHLAHFRHPSFGRVRGVERIGAREALLAIVSDATPGVRLSEVLARAEEHRIPLDINTALCLLRQLVPAVATLHENAREAAHGAIGPERLIVTPDARLVVVEYVTGAALEQLHYSRERCWTELRVALPRTAGLSRFDQRVDVTQVGAVALALLLGRQLRDDEYPGRVNDLVASTWALSARGGFEPLPPGLRGWLGRALQLDARNSFASAIDARVELDKMLGDSGYMVSPQSLEEFLARYRAATGQGAGPVAVRVPVAPVVPVAAPRPVTEPAPVAPVATSPAMAPIRIAEPSTMSSMPSPSVEPSTPRTLPAADTVPPAAVASASSTGKGMDEISTKFAATESKDSERAAGGHGKKSRWPMLAAVAALVIVATGGYAARRYFARPAALSTGTLAVTTNPPGALLFVDGESRGSTPTTLTLAAGSHQIELRGSGDPRSMPVTIAAGTASTQYIELPAAPATTGGQLQVRTEPAGAQVTVDGIARGMSPLTVSDLIPGEHAVVLTHASGTSRQTVTVERGATASLVVSLASADTSSQPGWISVKAPVGVQIFESNRLLGTSATDQIMVPAGRHDIDLVNDALGYRVSRTVQVPAGKVASVSLELPKGTLAINAVPWAEVWIDGEKAGDTPLGNLSLTIGPHDVVFRHPDLGEQHQTAMVTLKNSLRLSVDLRKK